jgi:hypothetical protein
MSAKCRKETFKSPHAPKVNVETFAYSVGSGRLFTISDEDLVDHVEHTNSKLPWH